MITFPSMISFCYRCFIQMFFWANPICLFELFGLILLGSMSLSSKSHSIIKSGRLVAITLFVIFSHDNSLSVASSMAPAPKRIVNNSLFTDAFILLSTFRHRLTHLHKFSHTLALCHCFHIKPICLHDNSVIIPKSYKVAFGIRRFESPQITSGDINPKGMYLRFYDECLGIMIYVSSGCRTSPNSIGYSASF